MNIRDIMGCQEAMLRKQLKWFKIDNTNPAKGRIIGTPFSYNLTYKALDALTSSHLDRTIKKYAVNFYSTVEKKIYVLSLGKVVMNQIVTQGLDKKCGMYGKNIIISKIGNGFKTVYNVTLDNSRKKLNKKELDYIRNNFCNLEILKKGMSYNLK